VQTTEPTQSAYVPAQQGVHVDPAVDEYDPLAQGVHDDAASDDDAPFAHLVHSVAVKVSVYVPAKHFWHADPPAGL
jgi:hypothetical protein